MKKLEGKITISRWQGNGQQKDGIRIDIVDNNSGCMIVDIEMTIEDFARCMLGSSRTLCNMDVFDSYDVLGKFPISKNVWVEYKTHERDPQKLDRFAKDSVKHYEVNGWQYSGHQLGNSHYSIKDGSQRYPVSLIKYVDTIEEKEIWDANKELHNGY